MQQPFRVLIVDDDYITCEFIEFLLARAGYSTATAPNGQVALSQLPIVSPDLILLDMMMPTMNGLAFLQNFSQLPYQPTVVLMSASDTLLTEAQRFGTYYTLPKPLEHHNLLACVERFHQQIAEENVFWTEVKSTLVQQVNFLYQEASQLRVESDTCFNEAETLGDQGLNAAQEVQLLCQQAHSFWMQAVDIELQAQKLRSMLLQHRIKA